MTKSIYIVWRGTFPLDICETLAIADEQIEFYEKHKLERKNFLQISKRQMITRQDKYGE